MIAVLEHILTVQTGIAAGTGYAIGYFMACRANNHRSSV